MRILSVLSVWGENMRNRTQHGLSQLTAISDAGSTPAASTISSFLEVGSESQRPDVAAALHNPVYSKSGYALFYSPAPLSIGHTQSRWLPSTRAAGQQRLARLPSPLNGDRGLVRRAALLVRVAD
jgi:hypothetical protein